MIGLYFVVPSPKSIDTVDDPELCEISNNVIHDVLDLNEVEHAFPAEERMLIFWVL